MAPRRQKQHAFEVVILCKKWRRFFDTDGDHALARIILRLLKSSTRRVGPADAFEKEWTRPAFR